MKYIILAILSIGVNGYAIDKETIKYLITIEAIHQGVDPNLSVGVATVESGLNPEARGSKGEIGLFQLLPRTTGKRTVKSVLPNIREGIRQIKFWQANCPTKEHETFIICYNQGYRHPKYPRLHPYYKKVMRAMK